MTYMNVRLSLKIEAHIKDYQICDCITKRPTQTRVGLFLCSYAFDGSRTEWS